MFTFDLRRLPGALRRWLRSPQAYRVAAVAFAVGVGWLTFMWLHRAETLAGSWGEQRDVLVATAPVASGTVLDGSVELRSLPIAVLPEGALDEVAPGAVAAIDVARGAIFTPGLVRSDDDSDTTRLTAPGRRGVTVARADVGVPVHPGDRVDVFVVPGDGRPPRLLTGAAPVVEVTDAAVTISVPTRDALAAVDAIATRSVQLAVVGTGG